MVEDGEKTERKSQEQICEVLNQQSWMIWKGKMGF